MLDFIWEYRLVRYAIYGSSIVLLSEILFHGYRYINSQLQQKQNVNNDDEIADVIWTNELTQTCDGRHRGDFATRAARIMQSKSTEQERPMFDKNRILRLPTPNMNSLCKNSFCAANNVGKLIMYVERAQYTIDLAMYTFTSYELCQAMTRAIRRGVKLRCVSDNEMVYSSGSQIKEMTKQGKQKIKSQN